MLLSPLNGDPQTYKAWADDYYETDVALEAVRRIYDYLPLTTEVVAALNPEVALEDLLAAIEEIDRALAKIEAGNYGNCEQCGRLIPEDRLRALPYAALCVACKSGGLSRRS